MRNILKMNFKIFILIGILVEATLVFGKYEHRRPLKFAGRNGEISDPNYYRLPNDIIPTTYDLQMIPVMQAGNFSFTGTVIIRFNVQNSTQSITLHTNGLHVSEHTLYADTQPLVNLSIVNATDYEDRDFHVLYLNNNLTTSNSYTLTMKFAGVLQEDLDGFYICSYKNDSGDREWMAVTQFEPVSARKAFPCFDESHLKANFSVSIARPMDMITQSNMPLKSSTTEGVDLPLGYIMDVYEESPKMSTYLVAFSVSKFLGNPPDEKESFRVWSRHNAINQTSYILGVAPKVLDVMRNITDIKYTLPKMDLVAVPDFSAGAMENWGLLTFRETFLLYQSNSSTAYDKQMVFAVVTHEMSHQWFGDLVSPEWWSYMWLNEGFATYWMYIVTGVIDPTWRMMEQFVVERVQAPLVPDAMEFIKPVFYNVVNPIYEDYESMDISYGKASSIIRMMEHVLTRNILYRGLRRYLFERQFSAAIESMLFDAINEEANGTGVLPPNVTVGDVWSTWTNQGGYPVITVNRDYELGKAVIDQKRFVLEDFDYNKQQRWWIPISYTTEDSANFDDTRPSNWMSPSEASITIIDIPLNSGWVIFNIQETGYYRVNYDEQNWKLIISYLKSEKYTKIPPVNRAQLVDDAFNLARGGYIKYPLAFELSQFLAQETDYIPWYSAYSSIDSLDMLMSESKYYNYFKVYVANISNAQYEKLGFNESSSDDHVTHLGRLMLTPRACKYDVGDCRMQALTSFHNWKQTNINTIPANLRDAAYCYGIAMGGKDEWNFLWQAYEDTTIAPEKEHIMGALGCSTDKDILTGYMDKAVENASQIRIQDKAAVFSSVYTRAEGLGVALDFLMNRFNDIIETCGMGTASSVILGISSRITTMEKASQMEDFLRTNSASLGGPEKIAEKSQKYIDTNLQWVKNYEAIVETWLKDNYVVPS